VRKLQKAAIIEDIQSKMARSQIGILTDFTGLKVESLTRLRRQLQEADGELKVVKNTLMVRAVAGDSHMAPLQAYFTGPNALTLAYQDPVAVAKILVKFAQEKPQFKIKAGVLGGQLLDAQAIDALSKLPAREVLMAQLLGVLKGVPTALVTVLSGVIRNLLNVLVAIKDQKEPQAEKEEPQAEQEEPQAVPETAEAGETVGDA
jgi:large subunit ribosomal protein L10